MPRNDPTQQKEAPKVQAPVQAPAQAGVQTYVSEVEINLTLLNNKLNFIVATLEQVCEKLGI